MGRASGSMAASRTVLTETEFDTWILPKEALAIVTEVSPHSCVDLIKNRIRSGEIKVAARKAVDFDVPEGRRSQQFILIQDVGWIDRPDESFWDAGDHILRVQIDPTGYAGTRIIAAFHGIRLDPTGFEELRRDLQIPSPTPPPAPPSNQISKAPAPIRPITTIANCATMPNTRSPLELILEQLLNSEDRIAFPSDLPSATKRKINTIAQAMNMAAPYPQAPFEGLTKSSGRGESPIEDDKLAEWYRVYRRQFPIHPHRLVKLAAEQQFAPRTVGKNQLYRVMRAVSGGLKAGNPSISHRKWGN